MSDQDKKIKFVSKWVNGPNQGNGKGRDRYYMSSKRVFFWGWEFQLMDICEGKWVQTLHKYPF